jgi:hypothetical protein
MSFIRYVKLVPDDVVSVDENVIRKIAIRVAKTYDKAIVDAVIDYAKNEGITDLYLLDDEFVTTALSREAERRKKESNGQDI